MSDRIYDKFQPHIWKCQCLTFRLSNPGADSFDLIQWQFDSRLAFQRNVKRFESHSRIAESREAPVNSVNINTSDFIRMTRALKTKNNLLNVSGRSSSRATDIHIY